MCIAMDLVNNEATLYLNGENQDERKILKQNYKSWIDKVPELYNGYFLEFARYTWDSSFTFATWVDFNAWNEKLPGYQMAKFSNCKDVAHRKSSWVNGNSKWNITGSVIKQVCKFTDIL